MPDTLASLAIELGIDDRSLERGLMNAVSSAQSAGGRAGSAFADSFASPFSRTVNKIQGDLRNAQELGGFALKVSGSETAAEFGKIRRQLAYITGDAKIANREFDRLQNMAIHSDFNAAEVSQLALREAGRTGDVSGAVDKVQNILDASAAFGVANRDFNQYQRNLSDIQNRGDSKVTRPDLQQLLKYAPSSSTAIAKSLGISVAEASKRMQNATGTELSKMIEDVGKSNRGLADQRSGQDPFSKADNIMDALKVGIEPTGRIINAALMPALETGAALADVFTKVNQATGGGAGLLAVVGIGVIGFRTFNGTVGGGIVAVRGFTAALNQASLRLATGGGGIPPVIARKAGAGGIAGVAGTAMSIGNEALIGTLILMGIQAGHKQMGVNMQESKDAWVREVGNIVSTSSRYAKYGSMIGGLLPGGAGMGSALGTAVGYGVGGTQSLIKLATGGTVGEGVKGAGSAAERTAKATEDAAKSLSKMETRQVGGGERFASSLKGLEFEHALLRSSSTGMA